MPRPILTRRLSDRFQELRRHFRGNVATPTGGGFDAARASYAMLAIRSRLGGDGESDNEDAEYAERFGACRIARRGSWTRFLMHPD